MMKSTTDQRVSDAAQAAAGAIAQAAAAAQADSRNDGSSPSQLNPVFIGELQHLHKTIFDSVDSIVDTLHDFKSKLNAVNVLITNNLLSKDSSTDDRLLLLQLQQETQNHLNNSHHARYSSQGDSGISDSNGTPTQNPGEEDMPEIDLNPRAKVVADLWDEWNAGYKGQPSLRSLEARYGTRWRKGRIAKSAQRRKKVIEFIEHESKKREATYSPVDIVDFLDKYRQVQQKGLFWLYGNLPKTLFDDNGNPIFVRPIDSPPTSNPSLSANSNSTAPTTVSTEGNYEPEHLDPAVTNS